MNFITCYPDANSFKDVIRIKSLEDWHVEYVPLSENAGYWIADNPFYDDGFELYRNLINAFPVVATNNDEASKESNPFATLHIPNWMGEPVAILMRDYYLKYINGYGKNSKINEWGNLYRNDARPIKAHQIPHIDYEAGIVGNLWLSHHEPGTTGTNIYEYSGKSIELFYDFQVDEKHPLHAEYMANYYRLDKWENFTDEEAEHWGFKKLGMAPCIEGKMTMYRSNQPHCPWISESVKFRWSHAYAFYHETINPLNLIR